MAIGTEKGKIATVTGGAVALIAGSAPSWINLFFDHGEELSGSVSSIVPIIQIVLPFAAMVAGMFAGWNARKWHASRHPKVDADAKDKTIDDLTAENEQLGNQLHSALMKASNLDEALAEANAQIRLQDEEAEEERRIQEQNLANFKEENGEKKAMAAAIYKVDKHKAAISPWGEGYFRDLDRGKIGAISYYPFFEFDDRDDFIYVGLVPWVKELFDTYPDQLEDFTEEVKQKIEEKLGYYNPF